MRVCVCVCMRVCVYVSVCVRMCVYVCVCTIIPRLKNDRYTIGLKLSTELYIVCTYKSMTIILEQMHRIKKLNSNNGEEWMMIMIMMEHD